MTSPIHTSVLDIRSLSVEFTTNRGRLKALRDVTLTVPNEKIVGLVGESGCGKSTVIFSILNLMAENAIITCGEVNFEGRDILKMSPTLFSTAVMPLAGTCAPPMMCKDKCGQL